jgi:hypothetical protein
MGNSWQVVEAEQFKEEFERLFDRGGDFIRAGLNWAVQREPLLGQKVVGVDRWAWSTFHGEFAYLVYYSVSGNTVKLESIIKRKTPVAPGPLGLES